MKKSWGIISGICLMFGPLQVAGRQQQYEPVAYTENFETRELRAWASYPLWQDTAFDPNTRPGTIVPGDPNISFVQLVTPFSNVDNYAGAQKKLDMWLVPSSTIKLRYYLKTQLKPEFIKIRLAAGPDGKADYTIMNPGTNAWQWAEVVYNDFVKENPNLTAGKPIKVNALAVLAKFPKADPAMPLCFGLDDVTVNGMGKIHFQFSEPKMFKLSEWNPYIPEKHYRRGDLFSLSGKWPLEASRVTLTVCKFTEKTKALFQTDLKREGTEWRLKGWKLPFSEGLYLARLQAFQKKERLSETEFTIFIADETLGGRHPRLWFDKAGLERVRARMRSDRFIKLAESLKKIAKETRERNPLESILFDVDQLPKDEPLIGNTIRTNSAWNDRKIVWRLGINDNVYAYCFAGDEEAGAYARALMVKLCQFPFLTPPWFEYRGQHIYYGVGQLGMDLAFCYDVLYDRLTESEKQIVQSGLIRNIIMGCHQSYVENDLVTNNTSNWVAHLTAGSLMSQAVIYGDSPDMGSLEPYLTGAILKNYEMIQKSFGRDGGYGESYSYHRSVMLSFSNNLPGLENVFKIDISGPVHESYKELIWDGLIKDQRFFYFGDSGGVLTPPSQWAWLLAKVKDPMLAWLYNFLKKEETFSDAIYEIENIPQKDPFGENPNAVYWDVGTTVFKSGWEKDDFVFVMRTGAFFNHQHLDQGTFWLADRGELFIEERYGSHYYDCPFYQSHFIQPIAHSTILIDRNQQSQRVGDPLLFAEGFHDHAFIHQFLEGQEAAFVSGDIGRLYWGKVKEMRRNVLYIKPRIILMLDTVVPSEKDVDVTLLYQTTYLENIKPNQKASMITKGKAVLHIKHLAPENLEVKTEVIPHFINTLKNEKPLKTEGMLTVTARTAGKPLVIANLLTTTTGGEADVTFTRGNGHVCGKAADRDFSFSTEPGRVYQMGGLTTDALAVTWDKDRIFAALATKLEKDGMRLMSQEAITAEISGKMIKFYLAKGGEVIISVFEKPHKVLLNGKPLSFQYDTVKKEMRLALPKGEGQLSY